MPNRIIKESICTSPEIDALTPEQESTFYRIMVNCDDYGRLPAEPKLLRAKLFPLRIDQVTDEQIEGWLQALARPGPNGDALINIYTVHGRRYLQMATWTNHQQIRAKRSKWPAPENGIAYDISGYQPPADGTVVQSNTNTIQDVDETSVVKTEEPQEPEKGGPDTIEYKLAEELKELILRNNPNAKVPRDLTKWALDVERMIRIDQRDPSQVLAVIRFSQEDHFWQSNILSARKVREKYDQLFMKSQREGGGAEPRAWNTIRQWLNESEGGLGDYGEEGIR